MGVGKAEWFSIQDRVFNITLYPVRQGEIVRSIDFVNHKNFGHDFAIAYMYANLEIIGLASYIYVEFIINRFIIECKPLYFLH